MRKRSFAVRTRASAGTMSPAERNTMSPGTTSRSLISFFFPSRITVAVVLTSLLEELSRLLSLRLLIVSEVGTDQHDEVDDDNVLGLPKRE